jgi:hypothetical protein
MRITRLQGYHMKIFVVGGVSIPNTDADHAKQLELLSSSMRRLVKDIISRGYDLVVCNRFP